MSNDLREDWEKQPKVPESFLEHAETDFPKLAPFLQRFKCGSWPSVYSSGPKGHHPGSAGREGGFLLHMMNSPSGSTVFLLCSRQMRNTARKRPGV